MEGEEQERRERSRNKRQRKLQLLPQRGMQQQQGIGQIRNQQEAGQMPRLEKDEAEMI